MGDDRVAKLIDEATRLRWNRRQILKRAAVLGLSAPAISAVLAACGDDDETEENGATATSGGGSDATATTGGGAGATPTTGGAEPTATGGESGGDATATTGGAEATQAPQEGGSGGIINLNTTLGDSGIGNPVITGNIQLIEWYVFNRLFHFDDEGSIQPELAKEWEWSDDSLSLTITLNEAKWHDGEDFTADDVIYTFDLIKDENTDTNRRSNLQVGGEFVTYEKGDDYTVTITMTQPYAPFLFALGNIPIVPEHVLSGVADVNTDAFNKNPIGTGSYTLSEWQSDQFVKLLPFEDHFRGRARNDGLTVFFHADTEVGSAALDTGDIDMMFTPPELQPRYEDNSDFTLYNYVYFTPITLSFNHKHPILSDIKVRQAIAMAIDKQTLTDTVTKGRGIVSNNQYADTGPLDRYNNYDEVQPIEFNVDEANRILDEAGYAMGSDGIRATADGERFSFNIITYSGFEEYVNDQVILQEMLGKIGIELTPQVVDYTTLEGMWADPNDDPANRALELEEWPHPFEFDPDVYLELHTESFPPGTNYMWFSDEEVDRLIEEGRTETDLDRRVEIYKELDVRRSELLPCVQLYCAVDGWVVSNRVQGVKDTPYYRRYVLIAAQNWWKEQ